MASYTFLWNNDTWDQRAKSDDDAVDYIAGENKRPFSTFVKGDEVFVITVKKGNLYIGGRLVVGDGPVLKVEAEKLLGRTNIINKDLYFIAEKQAIDKFRAAKLVDLEVAKNLDLITSKGERKKPNLDKSGGIDRQAFRIPFQLTKASADKLRDYLDLPQNSEIQEESSGNVAAGSAGIQDDPEKKRITENYAVSKAKEYYLHQEFSVEEYGKPFDLLCQKKELVVHVEVKGSTGNADTVILTRNEVKDARENAWRSDLFIVRNILLQRNGDTWEPSGGEVFVLEGWAPNDEDLDPREFDYRVPKK